MHYPIFSDLRALRFLGTAGLCAAWGMAVAVPVLLDGNLTGGPIGEVLSAIGSATVGAGLAGLLLAGFFGRPGRFGWISTLLGGVLATVLGAGLGAAVLGGAKLAAPASVVIPAMILQQPLVLMLWAVCLICVHLGARALRRIYGG